MAWAPDHLAQRRVKQMRAGVVAHRRRAGVGVDRELRHLADANRARGHLSPVHDQVAHRLLGIRDLDLGHPAWRSLPRSPTCPPLSA